MCGFIGCFGHLPREEKRISALACIEHRGPDDTGVSQSDSHWMGFKRLSIQDLNPSGHQPMVFGGGRYVLVFNGEIYNHHALREKYLSGIAHQSTGDTEVIGQLLERLPVEQVLPELRGMFAFIWYDSYEKSVLIARDRFGIKPLYFSAFEQTLCVGSELRSLLGVCPQRGLNVEGLRSYFSYGSVSAPDTLAEGVRCLMLGHFMRWTSAKGVEIHKWHQLQWQSKISWMDGGMPAWREAVRETVFDSIQSHLLSDVEVGVFLSGGLDSSLAACAMKHVGQDKIKAFSVGYEQDVGVPDESDTAAETAKFLGAKFERHIITAQGMYDGFSNYIRAMDQPTGDALNTYLVSKIAAQSVKVAISGVGVDEMFGGYTYHKALYAAKKYHLLNGVTRSMMPSLEAWINRSSLGVAVPKLGKVAQFAKLLKHENLLDMQAEARTFFRESELRGEFFTSRANAHKNFIDQELIEAMAPHSFRNQLFALETMTYLPNTLLRDADWASMAFSLELRTPFVDQRIFNLSTHLPPDAKLTANQGKRVFRECFKDIIPPWILNDTKKKTFTLPKMKWLRAPQWQERIQDSLRSESFQSRGFFSKADTERVLDDFYSSEKSFNLSFLMCQKVWLLYVMEEWLNYFPV